jgi:hypothetical protein
MAALPTRDVEMYSQDDAAARATSARARVVGEDTPLHRLAAALLRTATACVRGGGGEAAAAFAALAGLGPLRDSRLVERAWRPLLRAVMGALVAAHEPPHAAHPPSYARGLATHVSLARAQHAAAAAAAAAPPPLAPPELMQLLEALAAAAAHSSEARGALAAEAARCGERLLGALAALAVARGPLAARLSSGAQGSAGHVSSEPRDCPLPLLRARAMCAGTLAALLPSPELAHCFEVSWCAGNARPGFPAVRPQGPEPLSPRHDKVTTLRALRFAAAVTLSCPAPTLFVRPPRLASRRTSWRCCKPP